MPHRVSNDEVDPYEHLSAAEREEQIQKKETKSRAVVLEMLGDLPSADVEAPDNVLFVCKLNPVTQDEDLELIFSRFDSKVKAEIIRDVETGQSLNYAFVEFSSERTCTEAYLKMNNALVDDRRIKVDFSQSVSKEWNKYTQQRREGRNRQISQPSMQSSSHKSKHFPMQSDANGPRQTPKHYGGEKRMKSDNNDIGDSSRREKSTNNDRGQSHHNNSDSSLSDQDRRRSRRRRNNDRSRSRSRERRDRKRRHKHKSSRSHRAESHRERERHRHHKRHHKDSSSHNRRERRSSRSDGEERRHNRDRDRSYGS